ncbi:Methyl-CpG-binding domain-containing protein 2 [Striga hermonthica]|uniref:Methyl-CpG-binding domain-containing protein 2 n=1 Tax=Striga hermonthica TaxID=68872 RepID=A0A9N7MUT0_STRHE|nr:Methyl-CpG-binding domain-containing protein 2 [Striga hermonthica]
MVREPNNKPAKRVWESVQQYTVRCGKCAKWRLIPTKEKYEQIRERIGQESFVCETGREWRPNISCNDEPDIQQDGSLMWAMDKPGVPQTPANWQRIIRVRAEGGTKFADVYYVSPSNKRLRSKVELERYLAENPSYKREGVDISRFSFQSPVALEADYVNAKRRLVATSSPDKSGILSN